MLTPTRPTLALALILTAATPARPQPPATDPAFHSAVAAWHMGGRDDARGRNPLRIVGAATPGIRLEGQEHRDSLAGGNDGLVARLDGGHLDAGQGSDGVLNLSGTALTVSVRLRCPSGTWDGPIFSKHGGHDRLVYNVYSSPSLIGFELGTRDTPGMTPVTAPLDRIGATGWHDVIARYDGKTAPAVRRWRPDGRGLPAGPLRTGNTAPCLIGAEPAGGRVKSGWKGDIDHVALWDRALPDADIERLAGGATRVAACRKRYTELVLRRARPVQGEAPPPVPLHGPPVDLPQARPRHEGGGLAQRPQRSDPRRRRVSPVRPTLGAVLDPRREHRPRALDRAAAGVLGG